VPKVFGPKGDGKKLGKKEGGLGRSLIAGPASLEGGGGRQCKKSKIGNRKEGLDEETLAKRATPSRNGGEDMLKISQKKGSERGSRQKKAITKNFAGGKRSTEKKKLHEKGDKVRKRGQSQKT